ncbi:MAG: VWA domain-containing protein [Coriobacteriia bacterium]
MRPPTIVRRPAHGHAYVALVVMLALVIITTSAVAAWAEPPGPPIAPDKLPVLLLDGGLGDGRFYVTHWLGKTQEVAANGPVRLLTSSTPTWWGSSGGPDTYLLTASDASGSLAAAPCGPSAIAWALDRLAERHPERKAMLVAQGASGIAARLYLEDLGAPKQSARADVVGLVMLGTPNAGLTLQPLYPDLNFWAPYAAGVGLTAVDLLPSSPLLASLNSGRFPAVVKTLVVQGVPVSLAEYETDGVAVRADSVLPAEVAFGAVDYVPVKNSASESFPLYKSWLPKTKKGGATLNRVDDNAVAKLALVRGYSTSPDVRSAVKRFYTAWFSGAIPITHISTRLVLDVSGSMAEGFGKGSKLDAATSAAGDFAHSLASRQTIPGAVPEDIGLVTFNEGAALVVAPSANAAAIGNALKKLEPKGNTNVGKALSVAVQSLAAAPAPAEKVVVLLSDGVNTAGLDQEDILSGPVAKAKASGVRIETIALGSVDSSDVGFLKKVAAATGGSFHQARDRFELRRDFLRARYSSLGTMTVDADIAMPAASPVPIGQVADGARLLEIGVLTDGAGSAWQLLRDGKPVSEAEAKVATSPDGVVSITAVAPKAGLYALHMVDAKGSNRGHVFAVTQVDAFRVRGSSALQDDTATLLLMALGVAVVAGIAVTIYLSSRGKSTPRTVPADERITPFGAAEPDDPAQGAPNHEDGG